MQNPVRYMREKFNAASSSWRSWRQLSAKAKTSDPFMARRMNEQARISRAEFFKTAGKLAGIGLGSASVGAAALIAVMEINEMGRVYGKLKNMRIGETPFPPGYFEELLTRSGISQKEILKISTANGDGAEGIAIMSYALLKKAQANGELSGRYNNFLRVVPELILDGRLRFDPSSGISSADGVTYGTVDKTIHVDPSRNFFLPGETYAESAIIRELFHVYQDHRTGVMPRSRYELEAILTQSDFILHRDPQMLHQYNWGVILPDKDGFSFRLVFPASVPRRLKETMAIESEESLVIEENRQDYLAMKVMLAASNPELFPSFEADAAFPQAVKAVYERMNNIIRSNRNAIATRPLRDHIDCSVRNDILRQAVGSGCKASPELVNFSSAVNFLAMYLHQKGDQELARRVINENFAEGWQRPVDRLLDDPQIDPNVQLTGF